MEFLIIACAYTTIELINSIYTTNKIKFVIINTLDGLRLVHWRRIVIHKSKHHVEVMQLTDFYSQS